MRHTAVLVTYSGAIAGSLALLLLTACTSALSPAPPASPAVTSTATPADALASRAGRAAPDPAAGGRSTTVTITAVGDTMLGNTPDLPPDPGAYFDAVESILRAGSPIAFANLEGTLTTSTASKCGAQKPQKPHKPQKPQKPQKPKKNRATTCFAFRDPPGYALYFKQAGFSVLNDANNHSFDFGAAGQAQTVRAIRAAGLAQTGLPGEITLVRNNGTTVAFLAFAPYDYDASLLGLPAARALIEKADREANVVVVYMHAGAEGPAADHVTGAEESFLGEDRGNAEAFAHMAIDAGASLVIASGPHVLRGMQFYRGRLIAYSLGDFAGYGDFATGGDLDLSVILRVTLSPAGRFEQARVYPVELAGSGRPVPGGGSVAFVAGLSSADFGKSAARISSSGAVTAP